MIDEDQLAAIRVRFFERRELPRHGAENLRSWFFVLGAWLFVRRDGGARKEHQAQGSDELEEVGHWKRGFEDE
jgi:hypothetical protein